MEYDVHFSLNGFYKITAESEEEAEAIAEEILSKALPKVEEELHTGIGIEVYETLESGVQ